MPDYKFYGWYSANKEGVSGLDVVVDVRDADGVMMVLGDSAEEVGGGLYKYIFSTVVVGDFAAVFKTTDDTVDAKHVPSLFPAQLTRLDEAISGVSQATYNRLVVIPAVQLVMPVSGSNVTMLAGDTVSFTLSGVGSLVGADKVYMSIKSQPSDQDEDSVLQLEKAGGVLYFNGIDTSKIKVTDELQFTSSDGALTVLNEATGVVKVDLAAFLSVLIAPGTYKYDVKVIINNEAYSKTQGYVIFEPVVTKSVS